MSVIKHKNPKKLKIFLLAFMVIALTAVIAVFISERHLLENPETLISSLPVDANLSIGKIHQTSTKNGVKEFTLDAASAYYTATKKEVVLTDLSVTFFLKNEQEVFLTANKGILQTDSKNIEITGNVMVKNKSSRLFTEQLQYKHSGRQLLSKAPVKIVGDAYQLKADRMSFDLNTNQTVLEGRVEGAFSENFAI
ncbi:MAG: LPS export ABC transporter periplasmic protein LptC [Thermodesulfobacteriota bacterium]|nr:LPS export ABC transporter periplasmic protein LptC [Thermodesulfobacteriota bacterium]